ncbi:MAG TPA: phosphomannomutase [Devosiaceae bacterium]|nr:phosphomannomutase [Devosiaceae bacterium]
MADSLKFGTSGLRGLAADLVGAPSRRYAAAFVRYLKGQGALEAGGRVAIGRDLRASSPAISASVIEAVAGAGFAPIDCGTLSTPALASFALRERVPAIMVTGSHIPADRNGLKFYLASGEISKADEAGIVAALAEAGESAIAGAPALRREAEAREAYLDRYRRAFATDALAGSRIGIFEHSSVLREDLGTLLAGLGATVVRLGRSEVFVPIDTEALSEADAAQARRWVGEHGLDALVSTDGDADRPLVADETGVFVRGDVLGILTARFLKADAVVTPVTSNSSIESLGFPSVIRTKVGSPFVIAGMAEARAAGARTIVGFEANGGVLLGSDVAVGGQAIAALPTRDAVLPILSVLVAARQRGISLSRLVGTLPARIARSDRLEHVPQERTAALLADLADPAFAARYFSEVGEVRSVSDIDGLRFVLASGDVVHYRASGNAPEMRCYTEAATAERAEALLAWGLRTAAAIVRA